MVSVAVTFTDPAAKAGDYAARELLLPRAHSAQAAGLDLCASEGAVLEPGAFQLVPTGVAVGLPSGYEAQVRPRSGLALKHGVTVLNAPGTIDADYRGEIRVLLINHGPRPFSIERGDRIAQLVIAPVSAPSWEICEELEPSARGDAGFGSTGTRRSVDRLSRAR